MMVRQVIRLKRAEAVVAAEPAATPEDVALLREIRDSLKQYNHCSSCLPVC